MAYSYSSLKCFDLVAAVTMLSASASTQGQSAQWQDPFPRIVDSAASTPQSLTLEDALRLVAQANLSLKAADHRRSAAKGQIKQAGTRPNPGLEFETENISGSYDGLQQSESAVRITQELELWGKRGARTKFAQAQYDVTDLQQAILRFDIYAETKLRYYEVLHAQRRVELSHSATALAGEVVDGARLRVQSGVVLVTELQLAELALSKAQIDWARAESDLSIARRLLASLWRSPEDNFTVSSPVTVQSELLEPVELLQYIDESRSVAELARELRQLEAERNLEHANAKPNLTIGGAAKRLAADDANTFVLGVAIPLPLFNRNQGNLTSIRSRIEATRLTRDQVRSEVESELTAAYNRLLQLEKTRAAIDTLILPKAEEVYTSVKRAYESGRISYASLLEAERSLIDHRSELNDLDLAIKQEVIAVERLLGIKWE